MNVSGQDRDDDPYRVRPPQRGNDERKIGQEKNYIYISEELTDQ